MILAYPQLEITVSYVDLGKLNDYSNESTFASASPVVVVTVFALLTALRPNPWYDPRYAIPLLGMILGNCMTGISLGLDTLTTSLVSRRAGVEAQLMLGATRQAAVAPVTRQALRSALMPTINSMSATGVVSLPGMMTGQI